MASGGDWSGTDWREVWQSKQDISVVARELWLAAGRPTGRDEEFWLAAEQELPKRKEKQARKERHDRRRRWIKLIRFWRWIQTF